MHSSQLFGGVSECSFDWVSPAAGRMGLTVWPSLRVGKETVFLRRRFTRHLWASQRAVPRRRRLAPRSAEIDVQRVRGAPGADSKDSNSRAVTQ